MVKKLRRIWSTKDLFDKFAEELKRYLKAHGYKKGEVENQIRKVSITYNSFTIENRRKKFRMPFVVSNHPGLPNNNGILRELQPVLHSSNRCKEAVKELSMVAFRRPKNSKLSGDS